MTALDERADPVVDTVKASERSAAPAPEARSRPLVPRGRGLTTWVLVSVSVLGLWGVLYALVLSGLQESHTQARSYATFRELLAEQKAPLGGQVAPGKPVALLNAPELGLSDLVVSEGTASGDLKRGPGHRRETVLPGQAGTSVVYGRSTLFGGPFKDIRDARPGDTITVLTGQGTSTYAVTGVRRVGDPLPAPLAEGGARLVLVTATGATAGNGFQPKGPLYVDATLKGTALPAPGGLLAAVPTSENAMQGDSGGLITLVLWLQLLLIAAGGLTWAASRWGAWQVYLVGAPAVLAGLWGASQTAVELLPNLM